MFVYIDIDECINGIHNCSSNANCTNLPGEFSCTCQSGYFGDGVTCLADGTYSDHAIKDIILAIKYAENLHDAYLPTHDRFLGCMTI